MYEEIIAKAGFHLSRRDDDPKKKADRQYVSRTTELFNQFTSLGFGAWQEVFINHIERKDKTDLPRVWMYGEEAATGRVVKCELFNSYNLFMPKDLTFRMSVDGQSLAIGQHQGLMHFTDYRTKESYYDGFKWDASRLNQQLRVEALGEQLVLSPAEVQSQINEAITQMGVHGIDNIHHAIMPKPQADSTDTRFRDIHMSPYLCGNYGDMPVAINISYLKTAAVDVGFYLPAPEGVCKKRFGYVTMDRSGKVKEVHVDIGALLRR